MKYISMNSDSKPYDNVALGSKFLPVSAGASTRWFRPVSAGVGSGSSYVLPKRPYYTSFLKKRFCKYNETKPGTTDT